MNKVVQNINEYLNEMKKPKKAKKRRPSRKRRGKKGAVKMSQSSEYSVQKFADIISSDQSEWFSRETEYWEEEDFTEWDEMSTKQKAEALEDFEALDDWKGENIFNYENSLEMFADEDIEPDSDEFYEKMDAFDDWFRANKKKIYLAVAKQM